MSQISDGWKSGDEIDPTAIDIANRMGVISEAQCLELMASTPIGRVGFTSDDAPLVLPVNFALHGGAVVFRTLEGLKLAAAAEGQQVCFEVDQWDAHARTGWSVVMRGRASEVTDWAEIEQLENVGLTPWAREKWRPLWVKIESTEISGRVLR